MTHARTLLLFCVTTAGFLRPALPAAAYIDGGGEQITLPEIILEFHTATLVEIEKADPARGAIRFKVLKPLKGKLEAKEIKLQLAWEGPAPKGILGLKPGQTAVHFTVCFDKRSLTYIDGVWAWTQPGQDGWESGALRPDFERVFIGPSTELADAVLKLLRGHEILARCRRRDHPSETQAVRYSMKTPNDKALVRDPAAPPAKTRPVSAWIADFQDEKPFVRVQAGLALAELGPAARDAEGSLVKGVNDPDPEVRYAAVLALGSIPAEGRAAVDALARTLEDKNWFVRFTATQALQKLGPRAKPAMPALVKALAPSDGVKDFRPIRCGAAMVAVARIDPGAKELQGAIALVVEKLLGYDGDGSDGARAIGAEMLGDCGPAAGSAVPALVRRLKDEEGGVRVAAALALLKIEPEKQASTSLMALAAELKNPDLLIRILAADALGGLGARARDSVPSLTAALRDPEPEVRQATKDALMKITGK
ncbi:MAG TPA: HEAT repeat domain-containing protein [Planctomycetota bacterium]|nr:HEAT repeat domain-containing protein [Planctomycetota bacterium]